MQEVVVLYFTASEKENLRTERKQNYQIKNEKKKITPLTINTWATEKGSNEGKLNY